MSLNRRSTLAEFIWLILLALLAILSRPAGAQTFTVLHYFTGGDDGALPPAGLTLDRAGNLYGAASSGARYGTVYELKRAGTGWTFALLYSFRGGDDGANPSGPVIFGPNGTLYGNTDHGGGSTQCNGGCGTVYNLQPPPRVCNHVQCSWISTVLHGFQVDFINDGLGPSGNLVFDQAGNLYGVTVQGGTQYDGTVFELMHANGAWTENVLHDFSGGHDGMLPQSGMVLDGDGNLYGAAGGGRDSGGVVYKLTHSGAGWTESVIESFIPFMDGSAAAGVTFDNAGSLFGGTMYGGPNDSGTIFELVPLSGGWALDVLYSLTGNLNCGVSGPLVVDAADNLYGSTSCGGVHNQGSVFKLSPSADGWGLTTLHSFSGNDGNYPNGSLVIDANGNIYGVTIYGGTGSCLRGCGTVFEITP